MFGSQVLEVMIGLLLIYLALSVACSGIKEVIANLFDLRSKTLGVAVRNMLQDAPEDLVQRLFRHPVIAGTIGPGNTLPSYISPQNFALALMGATASGDGETVPRTIQDLRTNIANLPSPRLRKTLLGLVDSAQGDLAAAQNRIERWFDDTMERVSGWYKRAAQKLIFGAGLALCLALNADTFQIAHALWSDEALRNAAVAQATKRVQEGRPVDSQEAGDSSGGPAPTLSLDQFKRVADEIHETHPLPLGWKLPSEGVWTAIKETGNWPAFLLKLVGILITSFAILMGAPFWFDLLNKVINLRISGNPPAPSR